jgi:hypothetical protein
MTTTILKSNLITALRLALHELKTHSEELGMPDYRSAYRAGLEQNLKDLMNGAELIVKED